MNYEAIKKAMQHELDNPQTCYMPCSPGEYVRDHLFRETMWEEATWFWGCYCRNNFNDPELNALNVKLKELTKNEKMPSWGTYGT